MTKLGHSVVGSICLVIAAVTHVHGRGSQATPANPIASNTTQHRAMLDRYCVTCHNERRRVAGLMLDTLDVDNIGQGQVVWEKVAGKLRAGVMPPGGMPRPDRTVVESFVSWLETQLDAAAAANPDPGGAMAHRLNRAEYANAIRDLLGLDVDIRALLPADSASFGFDNIADSLLISPTLTSRYLSAAARISRVAVGRRAVSPAIETYAVRGDLVQEDRVSEELPFGSRGGTAIQHSFPSDGEYEIRIRLQRNPTGNVRGIRDRHDLEVRLDGVLVQRFTVGGEGIAATDSGYSLNADDGLQFRLAVKAGRRMLGVAFFKQRSTLVEGLMDPLRRNPATFNDVVVVQPGISTLTVSGPYGGNGSEENAAARRRIFVCQPTRGTNESSCAHQILSNLVRRAYRRPVTEADLRPLLTLYRGEASRNGFDSGIEMALRAILVSPEFLFRIEEDPPNVAPGALYRISGIELASRLSFFLWSSLPDEELLALAVKGKLRNEGVLAQQVRRMLADDRARALIKNFAGQWLQLRNVPNWRPDPAAAPSFDDSLRQAFLRETELFFEGIVFEDRNILELLNANYTFLNEQLARHYGIANVHGPRFRRVILENGVRGGLLGQASILMVTSYPNRTSPVLRGKFILENILGTPPPPPPPNVPELKEGASEGKILSMRQRMEHHRANPACAGCHARMDPLGFALENFDMVGGWRGADESRTAIDATGALPDGTTFDGAVSLRKALMGQSDAFVGTLTTKLLTYALGRGVTSSDAPAVRQIKRQVAADNYRFSALILQIVRSAPFQMRKARAREESAAVASQGAVR